MKEPKKLYRDTSNKMVAGVASGAADFANMDVTVMRLLFVLAFLITGGAAVLAYIIAAIVVPEKPAA